MEFQLAASRGGWHNVWACAKYYRYFNSQPHEEADGIKHVWRVRRSISTRSLTRRLTFPVHVTPHLLLFQLAASRGGWHQPNNYRNCLCYFNSQPHEEADIIPRIPDSTYFIISTRSLTRRLTAFKEYCLPWYGISTRSLTRRLTAILDKISFI